MAELALAGCEPAGQAVLAARAKLAQKFDAVRTGGKGTTRRRDPREEWDVTGWAVDGWMSSGGWFLGLGGLSKGEF